MFVKEINLIGFRNYLEAQLKLDKQKTIIIGRNAQGKSNLIEVIQLLSYFKSRRSKKDAELINFEMNEAVVKVHLDRPDDDTDDELALLIRKSGRRTYKLNGSNQKVKDILHKLLSVSFMSEDLNIINSSPSTRRDYLDSIIKQVDLIYLENLSNFEKSLTQRNSYLKDLIDKEVYYPRSMKATQKEQLQIWNEVYIDHANKVIQSRRDFINQIEPLANKFYQEISGKPEAQLSLNYASEDLSLEALDEILGRDLARGYSNLGPHRDDFEILLNDKDASSFASQGEKRSIILALKLSELELLHQKHDQYPVLLLDDVLAELDEDRQDFLLDAVSSKAQVIITTTHLGKHLEKWSQDSQIVEIEDGAIVHKELALN